MVRYNEEGFLEYFSEFIKKLITIHDINDNDTFDSEAFEALLEKGDVTYQENETKEIFKEIVQDFIQKLDLTDFNNGLIPYHAITDIVYRDVSDEVSDYLFQILKKVGTSFFESYPDAVKEETKINYFKIIRHIQLAVIQKTYLYQTAKKQLTLLISENQEVKKHLEKLNKANQKLNNKIIQLEKRADKKYNNLISQFIAILGIFAAILMGAFGSIQSFTSLFDNANSISLGRLLIISSIGASSVLLILFFLLDSLAKLTGRSIASSHDEKATLFEKYPFIFLSHGILIIVALVGVALIISKHESFNKEWLGWWWWLPGGWIILLIIMIGINFLIRTNMKRKKSKYYQPARYNNIDINQ